MPSQGGYIVSCNDCTCTHIFTFDAGGIGNNGQARLDYFKNVVAVPSVAKTGGALSFNNFHNGQLWLALITFLYGAPEADRVYAP